MQVIARAAIMIVGTIAVVVGTYVDDAGNRRLRMPNAGTGATTGVKSTPLQMTLPDGGAVAGVIRSGSQFALGGLAISAAIVPYLHAQQIPASMRCSASYTVNE